MQECDHLDLAYKQKMDGYLPDNKACIHNYYQQLFHPDHGK